MQPKAIDERRKRREWMAADIEAEQFFFISKQLMLRPFGKLFFWFGFLLRGLSACRMREENWCNNIERQLNVAFAVGRCPEKGGRFHPLAKLAPSETQLARLHRPFQTRACKGVKPMR